jgi:nucleoside 2-deoxyribosyltransferase
MNEEKFDISPDGLFDLIKKGESDIVEFKTRLPAADIISRVFAAFANSNGGILIIGVADNGNIVGLSQDEAVAAINRIHTIASSLLPQSVQLGSVEVQGRFLVYAVVQKVSAHYGPIMSARGEIYQRSGQTIVMIPGSSLKGAIRSIIEKPEEKKDGITAFVAMSFREEEEPSLIDYYKAMERATLNCKLPIKLRRVDLVEGDYEISQKIMGEIDKADIVIADFTLSSRNVYFELGYARGLERRIIQTARKGTQMEFDVRNWRTIFYRNATELEAKLLPELQTAFTELNEKNS